MCGVKPLILGMALAYGLPAGAAELPADLAQVLKQMQERLAKLETRNAELERQLGTAPAAGLEARVKELETANAKLDEAMSSDRLSQDEPELATRLKAAEFQALGMQKQARAIEALEGVSAGVSFTSVAQHANAGATTTGQAENQLTWRGDAQISLPGGSLGASEGSLFFHFRMGQGKGLGNLNPTFSVPNATVFQLRGSSQPDDASPILAQAWYQLSVPLDGRPLDNSKEHLEANFGKIDPFLFFDQNAAADDETVKFMNLAFVHNPLLDAGGAAGVDAYGFTPGLRLAYHDDTQSPIGWGVSLGVFGSDTGAAFADRLRKPFAIVQAQTTQRFGGLKGDYRLYAWRNGRAMDFSGTTLEAQTGWGLSVDQRLGDGMTLFGRYGQATSGNPAFDRALTLGAEFSGNYWDRAGDSIGLAVGWLAASDAYKLANTGFGTEQLAELYYRWRVNGQFDLTPDYQFIRRPGGDPSLPDAHILGLRAQLTF